jgi:hypothetical protein
MKKLFSVFVHGLAVVLILLFCIHTTAVLATSAVVGLFSAVGLFLVLGNSSRSFAFALRHKEALDGTLFICGTFMTLTLGVTIGLSMVFFGIFVTLILRIFASLIA